MSSVVQCTGGTDWLKTGTNSDLTAMLLAIAMHGICSKTCAPFEHLPYDVPVMNVHQQRDMQCYLQWMHHHPKPWTVYHCPLY